MDELDLAIVQQLRSQGRKPYTEIAEALGVSEGTVRNRVARLCEEQVLHIVGMVDPYHMGMDAPASDRCFAARRGSRRRRWRPSPASRRSATWSWCSGEFDLIVEAMCRDRDHLADFLNEKLRRVPGVVATRTFTILRTYKMAYGARPMLGAPNAD